VYQERPVSRPVVDGTTTLAEYAAGLDLAKVPDEVVRQARIVLADTVGVLLSASTRNAVHTALRALPLASGPCTVIGHGRGAAPESAAFINGIGGHDIELDDSHSPSRTHPAAVIIPAALAAAELDGPVSYGDLLAGIIVAYDLEGRISKAMGPSAQYDHGFHPSAVCGVFGSAVAAARILGLGVDQLRSAIGLAASQSSGLLTYADDPFHMAKSFQTGVAARNGVTAALFAARGYKAAPDVLTGRRSVLGPFSGDAVDTTQLVAELDSRFEIRGTSLKRHACCGLTHSSVDAVLELMEDPRVTFDAIQQIEVQLPVKAVPRVDGNRLWSHNIQYIVALAAHEGRVVLEHFTEEWTRHPEISRLAGKVTVLGSDELQRRFPERKGAIVTITTPAGKLARKVDAPRGSPGQPLTERELNHKYAHLAGAVLSEETAASLWDELTHGPLDEPIPNLFTALASTPGASGSTRT
jgi:2-methylcitrate dehydratase PrpD